MGPSVSEEPTPEHVEIVTETFVLPTGMAADDKERHIFALRVEWQGVTDQFPDGSWRVTDGYCDLSRAENWSMPRRFQRHQYRWATREEALAMARKHVDQQTVNGRTWAEWRAHFAEKRAESPPNTSS